jgi:uncharacterized protein YqjF (DUF2071 family)
VLQLHAAARQRAALERTEHRPWPVPERSWFQGQTWERLLFAHWRLPEEALRPLVPPELPLDTHDGSAWLAVTPFRITGLRLRGLPPLPFVSTFLELNVRTYVTLRGRPGIYFFSLDAASRFAVGAARRLYKLPYFRAQMSAERGGAWVEYSSERRNGGHAAALRVRYRGTGDAREPEAGTLEHFLTERYCLYVVDERRDVHRADIHHAPWLLQPAAAELAENSMAPGGIDLSSEPALLHYSERQDVVIWAIAPAEHG